MEIQDTALIELFERRYFKKGIPIDFTEIFSFFNILDIDLYTDSTFFFLRNLNFYVLQLTNLCHNFRLTFASIDCTIFLHALECI